MKIRIQKLEPSAIVPQYASEGAACFDLHSIENGYVGENRAFRTGLKFEIPAGYVMLIFSRSGHGFNQNIRLSNCVGVIDSDYRGEVLVKLRADGTQDLKIREGDRIAQGLVIPLQKVEFKEVEELSFTVRGAGGFGSTGK